MSKVWVARDHSGFETGNVSIFKKQPVKYHYGWCAGGKKHIEGYMDKGSFATLFGFTPRKGSCRQMELSLTEVKK